MRKWLCIFLMFSVLLKSAAGLAMQVQMANAQWVSVSSQKTATHADTALDTHHVSLSATPSQTHTADNNHSLHQANAMPCHTAHTAMTQPSAWDTLVQATHSQCDGVCPAVLYVVPACPIYALAKMVHAMPMSVPFSIIVAPAVPPIKPPVV